MQRSHLRATVLSVGVIFILVGQPSTSLAQGIFGKIKDKAVAAGTKIKDTVKDGVKIEKDDKVGGGDDINAVLDRKAAEANGNAVAAHTPGSTGSPVAASAPQKIDNAFEFTVETNSTVAYERVRVAMLDIEHLKITGANPATGQLTADQVIMNMPKDRDRQYTISFTPAGAGTRIVVSATERTRRRLSNNEDSRNTKPWTVRKYSEDVTHDLAKLLRKQFVEAPVVSSH
jgi:hypothetical protein